MSLRSRVFDRAILKLLARLQGNICAHCGQPVARHERSGDHVVPASLGGPDAFGNWVLMHGACNRRKANRMPNGCEMIWLLAVNARLGVGPQIFGVVR